jgi:hypothetical protein
MAVEPIRNNRRPGGEGEREDDRLPGEQPVGQEAEPLDDAPVPPLTTPEDTEGG